MAPYQPKVNQASTWALGMLDEEGRAAPLRQLTWDGEDVHPSSPGPVPSIPLLPTSAFFIPGR